MQDGEGVGLVVVSAWKGTRSELVESRKMSMKTPVAVVEEKREVARYESMSDRDCMMTALVLTEWVHLYL